VNVSYFLRFATAGLILALAVVAIPPVTTAVPIGELPAAAAEPLAPAPSPPAATSSTSQMATLWNAFRTAQLQAEALQAQINQESAQRAQLQRQTASYTAQIAAGQVQQAADAAQVRATDAQLGQIQASIVTTTAQAAGLTAGVSARVVSLYQQGPASYLGMLLSATSIQDFLSRLTYVDSVLGADKDKLSALEQVNATLAQEQAQARQRRTQIATAEAAEAADGAKLVSLRAGEAQLSAALAANQATQQGQLAQVDAEKATYQAAMQEQAGEASSITVFVRKRQGDEAYLAPRKLIWPVRGPISSPFGPRLDPIFHVPSFHTGLDIAADLGTPILAAVPGTVIYAGLMEGYGNVVILDDGNAFATLYAHMSVLGATLGETVAQGQRIGEVGCTGLCTGPHVHFETRVGGVPENPLDFLP
jgi:murein DD-endopeptidase MepM/ murein hydrolase activator NlpD